MPVDPTQLAAVLRNTPEYKVLMDGGTGQDLADLLVLLNTKNRPKVDNTIRNVEYFLEQYGVTQTTTMLNGFETYGNTNVLGQAMFTRLINAGLNFNEQRVQDHIERMRVAVAWGTAGVSNNIANTLKALGRWNQSHAEDLFGIGTTLVAQDILDANAVYQVDILAIQVTERYNEVRLAIEQGMVTTWEEARTMLGGE